MERPSEPTILYEAVGHVRVLRINRPHRLNALCPATIEALRTYLIEFRDDSEARVCILTGTGTRAFCTGADLKETLPPATAFAAAVFEPDHASITQGNYIRGLDLERLDLGKPIIAAVNGHAVGGGMELALACDIRIASETATFGLPEVKVGSIPAVGGIQRLIRYAPHSLAMQMILTGERIDAATAARIGLVSAAVPPDQLLERAMEVAQRIAANAPLAVKAARMLAIEGINMPIPQAMLLEQFVWGVLRDTADRVEGRKAFAEKRAPVFRGR